MGYASANEVKIFNRDMTMDEDLLAQLLDPVSEAIDGYCRRKFTSVNEARSFDFTDDAVLTLPFEVVSVSQVTTNANQTFTAADFDLEPQAGPPYRWIYMKPQKRLYWSATTVKAVTITAAWGYKATVPQGIKLATIMWASKLYNQSDTQGFQSVGGAGSKATMSALPDEPPDDIKPFLKKFRRIRIEGLGA